MSSEEENFGSCFCGSLRFSIRLPTLFCVHCHCSMCRRAHGAGFVTWISVPREQFRIESGGEHLSRFSSSDHGARSFCTRCGSSLFCESETHPERIDIVLANMETSLDRRPEAHVYFDDRAEWIFVEDGLTRLGGETGVEKIESD